MLWRLSHVPRHAASGDEPMSACRLRADFTIGKKGIIYTALAKYTTTERNVDEVLAATEKWNLKEFTGQSEWVPLPISGIRQASYFISPSGRLSRKRRANLLHQYSMIYYGGQPSSQRDWPQIYRRVDDISQFVSGITYYSASQFTGPYRCPPSFEIDRDRSFRRLPRGSAEHVQFMYDLYTAYKDKRPDFGEFESIVGKDGVGLVDSISFDEIKVPSTTTQVITGGRVIQREVKRDLVIPNFLIQGTKLSPNQLSEGTFNPLAMVFYIVTDRSTLLLLEEPEVCIHHGLLSSVVEVIKEFAKKKQIVISTHSDFVLDAIAPENVFLVSNKRGKGTRVRHVPKVMSSSDYAALKQYLATTGNLGEYWRHGDLEG